MKNVILLSLSFGVLANCSITVPVAAIDESGHVMRGHATATMSDGTYTLSDGKAVCTGSYDPLDTSQTIPLSVLCNDGRTGIGSATRTADGTGGSGQFSMNDGTQWRFVFGKAATALL